MEQQAPAQGGMNKKLIIAGAVLIILLASVLTALQTIKVKRFAGKGGVMMGQPGNFDASVSSRMNFAPGSPAPLASGGAETLMSKDVAFSEGAPAETIAAPDKQVIKNGNLDLRVNDADETLGKVAQIASANGGEIFSSSFFQTEKNVKSGSIQVKVPADKFEKTFAELKKVATLVIMESTSGQDVTMEYVDLQIQLKNKQAEEQSYLRILDQAQKVSDIIEVTQQLSMVRGEIERIQGQVKFMDSQIKLASIFISLTEDTNITITDSWRPWQVAKDAVNQLLKGAQGFVNSAIVFVIVIIPIAIFYGVFFWIIYLIGKKIYQKIKERRSQV